MFPFIAPELDAEGRPKCLRDRCKRVGFRSFDTGPGFAGVAREIGRKILGRGKPRAIEEDAAEVFGEPFAEELLLAGVAGEIPETADALGEVKALPGSRLSTLPSVEGKAAVVREEDLAVMLEVATHLWRLRELEQIVVDRFHLEHAALRLELEERYLVGVRPKFPRGKEAAVGQPSAAIGRMDHGDDLRFERRADFVQERREGGVAGRLCSACSLDRKEIPQIAFQIIHRASEG
jgi:hypothetical protein